MTTTTTVTMTVTRQASAGMLATRVVWVKAKPLSVGLMRKLGLVS
jgi:hypothetical protein